MFLCTAPGWNGRAKITVGKFDEKGIKQRFARIRIRGIVLDPIERPEDAERDARKRLQEAARRIDVNPELGAKIQQAIRNPQFQLRRRAWWAGALVAVCLLSALAIIRFPFLLRQNGGIDVDSILEASEEHFRTGLADHLECALQLGARPLPKRPSQAPLELSRVVENALGDGMRIADVHRCVYRGQPLTHFIAEGRAGKISVVFAPGARSTQKKIQQHRVSEFSATSLDGVVFVVSSRSLSEDLDVMKKLSRQIEGMDWSAAVARFDFEDAGVSAAIP